MLGLIGNNVPNQVYYETGAEITAWETGYSAGDTKSVTKEATDIIVNAARISVSTRIAVVTAIAVNLTTIKRLKIEWENTGSSSAGNESHFMVSTNKTGDYDVYNATTSYLNKFSRRINELNVENLSGLFYIRAHARVSSNGVTSNIIIHRVWGES